VSRPRGHGPRPDLAHVSRQRDPWSGARARRPALRRPQGGGPQGAGCAASKDVGYRHARGLWDAGHVGPRGGILGERFVSVVVDPECVTRYLTETHPGVKTDYAMHTSAMRPMKDMSAVRATLGLIANFGSRCGNTRLLQAVVRNFVGVYGAPAL